MISLTRMVYRSQASSPDVMDLLSLSEILGASRRNNPQRALTGLLLAHEGWFLQVLEGQPAYLDLLMRDLALDTRHRDIEILSSAPVTDRLFGDWSMAQARITPAVRARLGDVAFEALSADAALDLLLACKPLGILPTGAAA